MKKKVSKKKVVKKKTGGKVRLHNNVINYADQDYYKKLDPETRKIWYEQFNAEYYSNDHSKRGSLFKTILGDKYYKELTNRTFKNGKKMSIKQSLFNDTNARNRCIMAISEISKFKVNNTLPIGNAYEFDKNEALKNRMEINERYEMNVNDVIEELLKSNTPKEVLEHLKVITRTAIQNEPDFIDEHINNLVEASMILALKATRKLK